MEHLMDEEDVRYRLSVGVSPERAFDVFVRETASWWPSEYTWAGNVLETIAIEPEVDGRCYERGPHGFHSDWGRVLEVDPPRGIRFLWQISPTRAPEPNPDKASEVEIRFEADGSKGSTVTLRHSRFDRHGDGGDGYRSAMASEHGWPYILGCFEAGCGE